MYGIICHLNCCKFLNVVTGLHFKLFCFKLLTHYALTSSFNRTFPINDDFLPCDLCLMHFEDVAVKVIGGY